MTQPRLFQLQRDTDVTGVSGTGIVADGIEFPDGVVALRWRGEWPTSVVFHDQGIDSVAHVHGHSGSTRIVFIDERAQALEEAAAAVDGERLISRTGHPEDDAYDHGIDDALRAVRNLS